MQIMFSFVGYAPADSPEISIAVRIANGYASTYAAKMEEEISQKCTQSRIRQ